VNGSTDLVLQNSLSPKTTPIVIGLQKRAQTTDTSLQAMISSTGRI